MLANSIWSEKDLEIPPIHIPRGFKTVRAEPLPISTVLSMLILGSCSSYIAEKVATEFEKFADQHGPSALFTLHLPSPATLEIAPVLMPLKDQPETEEKSEVVTLDFHLDRNGFILS